MKPKPHIQKMPGGWAVWYDQHGVTGWQPKLGSFLEAQELALNAFSWQHYQCSGAFEKSPLHSAWQKLRVAMGLEPFLRKLPELTDAQRARLHRTADWERAQT